MKTTKEKVEAYVRSQIPELMELSKNCSVYSNLTLDTGIFLGGVVWLNETEGTIENWHEDMEIIGHPIRMNDWLRVLSDLHNFRSITFHIEDDVWEVNLRKNVDGIEFEHLKFNLTTGLPATELDYQTIAEILNIEV